MIHSLQLILSIITLDLSLTSINNWHKNLLIKKIRFLLNQTMNCKWIIPIPMNTIKEHLHLY